MSSPITQNPVKVSAQTLERSNAIRQAAGLPPLQQAGTIQVIKGTQSSQPEGAQYTRSDLANLQGQAANIIKENEAVPFLAMESPVKVTKSPITPESSVRHGKEGGNTISLSSAGEGKGTDTVPYTNITDVIQFYPIGIGSGALAKGVSPLSNIAKSGSKQVIKTGSADIGLGIKESKSYQTAKLFEAQARTLPKPNSIKSPIQPPQDPFRSNVDIGSGNFRETKVNLGSGTGRVFKMDHRTGGLSEPKAPSKPPNDPFKSDKGYKTVGVGKGLQQIIREKPEMKQPIQRSQFKEYPLSLGKSKSVMTKIKVIPKNDQLFISKTKQVSRISQRLVQRQRQTQKQSVKQIEKEKEKLLTNFVNPKTSGRSRLVNVIPQRPQQKQPEQIIPKVTPKIPEIFKVPNTPKVPPSKQPSNIPKLPPNKTPPPTKKRPPEFPFALGSSTGGGGKAFGLGGNTKRFTGNVPENQFTGLYNRPETIYGKVKNPKVKEYQPNTRKSLSSRFKSLI